MSFASTGSVLPRHSCRHPEEALNTGERCRRGAMHSATRTLPLRHSCQECSSTFSFPVSSQNANTTFTKSPDACWASCNIHVEALAASAPYPHRFDVCCSDTALFNLTAAHPSARILEYDHPRSYSRVLALFESLVSIARFDSCTTRLPMYSTRQSLRRPTAISPC